LWGKSGQATKINSSSGGRAAAALPRQGSNQGQKWKKMEKKANDKQEQKLKENCIKNGEENETKRAWLALVLVLLYWYWRRFRSQRQRRRRLRLRRRRHRVGVLRVCGCVGGKCVRLSSTFLHFSTFPRFHVPMWPRLSLSFGRRRFSFDAASSDVRFFFSAPVEGWGVDVWVVGCGW